MPDLDFLDAHELESTYEKHIDWLMENGSRTCRFIYPPAISPCPNCYQTANGTSNGKYNYQTGIKPFSSGMCPVCLGKGKMTAEREETGKLIVIYDPNDAFFEPQKVSNIPAGSALCYGKRKDTWKHIVSCERIVVDTDVYAKGTVYRLFNAPRPLGLFKSDVYYEVILTLEGAG
jgi:hypothetical protein